MFRFGIPHSFRAPEEFNAHYFCSIDPPAGGGGGGDPPAAPVAPWGADANAMWKVADKPWFETFVPEGPAREHMKAKQYANPLVVAESLYAANKLIRDDDKRVLIPGDDAKPEEREAFFTKLGRPANADAYEWKAPEGSTIKADEGMMKFAKQFAFDNGMAPKAFQGMVDRWNEFQTKEVERYTTEAKTANDAAMQKLTESWKGSEELEKNRAAGDRVVKALGYTDAELKVIEDHIGAAPVLDLIARIGRASAEGTLKGGGGGGGPNDNVSTMTQQQAQQEITRLTTDAEFQKRYTDKGQPGHTEAVERMQALYARAG